MVASFWRRVAALLLVVALVPVFWLLFDYVFYSWNIGIIEYIAGPVVMSMYLAFLVRRSGGVARIIAGVLALSMLLPSWIFKWLESTLDAGCKTSVTAAAGGGYVDQYSVLGCEISYSIAFFVAIAVAYVCSIIFALTIIIHERVVAEIRQRS